jgi:hypothetical protein
MSAEPESADESLRVPIDSYAMQLRPSEVRSVAGAVGGTFDPFAVVDAVRALPAHDRAPFWELATRHFARHKPVQQAAGEIGMDTLHARALLDAFARALVS